MKEMENLKKAIMNLVEPFLIKIIEFINPAAIKIMDFLERRTK